MTLAKPTYAHSTYLLTRRCVQRQFWLLPTPIVEAVFGYALGLAAQRHGVKVHNALVLSNHWHAVVTDPGGVVSDFARDVHALVARALNARLGRSESMWSSSGVSLVRLIRPEDVYAKMLYTEVNAVAAHLVSAPERWAGLRVTPRDALRRPRIFRRPRGFFREGAEASCPEEVELEVTVPACVADGSGPEGFVRRFEESVAERVGLLRKEASAAGETYLGMRRVLTRKRRHRPAPKSEPDPRAEGPKRARRPTVACGDAQLREQVLADLARFRSAYGAARVAWLAGEEEVTFPYGTNLMRGYPNVRVARPPDDAPRAAA